MAAQVPALFSETLLVCRCRVLGKGGQIVDYSQTAAREAANENLKRLRRDSRPRPVPTTQSE